MENIEQRHSEPLVLQAPVSGPVVPLEAVPDPVFAQKIVGEGIAVDPIDQILKSPCAGRIVQLHRAHHAITVESQDGVQVLLHIGLDTVKLNGQGFNPKVKVGDTVRAGQALIEFSADEIAQKAKSLITLMVISNADPERITFSGASHVTAGQDALLNVRAKASAPSRSRAQGAKAKSKAITIELPTGLHARPASLLAQIAKNYRSDVEICKGAQSANAKSVVDIMALEIGHGDHVFFQAQGADKEKAVAEMAQFLSDFEEAPSQPTPVAKQEAASPRVGNEQTILGVGVSPGIAIGRIRQLHHRDVEVPNTLPESPARELTRFESSLQQAIAQLEQLAVQVKEQVDASRAAIFLAHKELLDDPALIEATKKQIEQGESAAKAWDASIRSQVQRLSRLNNELMANRANDLRDVGQRVLRLILGLSAEERPPLAENTILISENLTPSETVQLDRQLIAGFCTTTGGATSHVAILARSLGLPAIAGLEPRALELKDDLEVILNGETGELLLNPSEAAKREASGQQHAQEEIRQRALKSTHQAARTRDGLRVEVAANIGSAEDARQAVEMGADGVGLLRSEFLFLERDTAPSEDEQFQVYQEIADILGPRPLVIRTLDVGGDKPLKYLPLEQEENPFLGIRGIRMGFLHPDVLRTQLRAILRVRTQGTLCVMFPMIATIDEFRRAKQMLEEERAKLQRAPVQVGIMVEVPSVALTADVFAREVDFFSVGTNDLTQYTLAMDRGHKGLAKQVDALHPSVLKLIALASEAAHAHGKWIGVCGGLASDLKAVPILIGLGIDELSVSIPTIPLVKESVRESQSDQAKTLAQKSLALSSGAQVRALQPSQPQQGT